MIAHDDVHLRAMRAFHGERPHAQTHARSAQLAAYFARWLAFLGVDGHRYAARVQHIGGR